MVTTMKEFPHQRGGLPYTISQTHHKRHRLKPTARALVRLLVVVAVIAGLLRWFEFFGPTPDVEEDPVEVYTPGQVDSPPRVDDAGDKNAPVAKPVTPAKPAPKVPLARQQELLKKQYDLAMSRMQPLMREVPVVYSVVIPTYMQYDTLRRAIDSVIAQEFASFEIIVVNDGNTDSSRFYEIARQFKESHPAEVTEVVIVEDGEMHKHHKAEPGVVRFVSQENGGLGSARNYGISLASGRWMLMLDSDDVLDRDFIKRVVTSLYKQNKNLINPGGINMIITDMGDLKGRPTPWQPIDILTVDLKIENAFHCSALFLKAVWEGGVHFKPVLTFGWEDWDFWLNFHQIVGIQPMYIRKPLFLYSSWGAPGTSMASFCSTNSGMCKAIFRLANTEYYDEAMVVAALNTLLGRGAGDDGSVVAAVKHSRWHHVEKMAKAGDPTAVLLTGLAKQVKGDHKGAIADYIQVLNEGCKSQGKDKYAYFLLSQLHEENIPSVVVPPFAPPVVICEETKKCAQLGKVIEQQLKAHRHEVQDGVPQGTFHMFLTKRPSNPQWTQLFHHSATSVLMFHPGTVLVLHVAFEDHESVTGLLTRGQYRERVILTPICSTYLAYSHGFQHIDTFMKKSAAGRPYYYSHYTDYYRFLVMYAYGGIYVDADIVLRSPITHLRNALSFEDERKWWVNGAFMSFEPGHVFVKSCLQAIPKVYDPYNWGTIGPLLLSKMTKGRNNVSPKIYPRESFYSVPWWFKEELTGKVLTDEKWEQDGKTGVLGYHFWSKLLFLDNVAIVPKSAAARALALTCKPDMACLYQDDNGTPFEDLGK